MAKKYATSITVTAERDILGIRSYITRDKPRAADNWVAKIEERISKLDTYPFRCEVVPESSDLGVEYRHALLGNYRIIFRVEERRSLCCE